MKLHPKTKNEIWWLLISVDYDYSRITIADHDINGENLTLWLEDKNDFKNTLDECLGLAIPIKEFAKVIREENMNSYEGIKMHPKKGFLYKTRIEINEPILWYQHDATIVEQQWAREALLKQVITDLVESEVSNA